MNWETAAINDLQQYRRQKESLMNISERIEALRTSFEGMRGALSNSTPVHGGGSRIEDRMLSNIVERERLKLTYRATARLVKLVERGLAGLDHRERLTLERFFVYRTKGHITELMEELHIEQAQVYRIKSDALYKFTVTMYGLPEY